MCGRLSVSEKGERSSSQNRQRKLSVGGVAGWPVVAGTTSDVGGRNPNGHG